MMIYVVEDAETNKFVSAHYHVLNAIFETQDQDGLRLVQLDTRDIKSKDLRALISAAVKEDKRIAKEKARKRTAKKVKP